MAPNLDLTEKDGYDALQAHLVERAIGAREKHSELRGLAGVRALLADPAVVRFPTRLAFDSEPLQAGEFAWAMPRGPRPSEGFTLVVHPMFRDRPEDLPLLVAYHIPTINYLDVATHTEAELFGATLLGMERDEYYARLCELADELPEPAPTMPDIPRIEEATAAAAGGGCGSSCGCKGGS